MKSGNYFIRRNSSVYTENTIIETNDKKYYLADVNNLKEENLFINPNKVEQIQKSFTLIPKLYVTYTGMMHSCSPITKVFKSDKVSEISATIY